MSTRQAISNARWVGVNQVARLSIQFISIAVLSRLLSPSDFGLMAMAAVVTNLGLLFRDLGTAAALIQRRELSNDVIDTVFWLNIAFGSAVAACVAIMAPFASRLFHAPALANILMVISLTFPISAVGASQLALFERDSRFRLITWIETSSAVAGLIIAIACALNHMGVYSFVFQALVTGAMSSLQIWLHSSHRPRWLWDQQAFKSIWHFSGNLTAFNLINYTIRNGDSILIGRILGSVSLGWYSVANRVLLFPLQNITYSSNRALLPVYSRYQDEPATLRHLYMRTLALIGSITAPLMFGLWALRRPFVLAAFGNKWDPVVDILTWFAPMGFFQSLLSTVGAILSAIGRTDLMRTMGLINSIILVSAFVFGIQFGLRGLAVAYFGATLLITLTTLQVTLKKIGSDVIELMRGIWKQTLCAVAITILLSALNSLLTPVMPPIIILAVLVPVGLVAYVLLLYFCSRPVLIDVWKTLSHRTPVVAS